MSVIVWLQPLPFSLTGPFLSELWHAHGNRRVSPTVHTISRPFCPSVKERSIFCLQSFPVKILPYGRPPGRQTMNDILTRGKEKREIVIADYNPTWPETFQKHASLITRALGRRALCIEHVGSTAVPGLAAKPIIDIVVVVENSSNEKAYLPALLAADYVLRVREPDWHQHRMLRTPELDVHVHIFSPGCTEVERMVAFRNHLRLNAGDRLRYEALKRTLAKQDWAEMQDYANAKTELVVQITAKALQQAVNVEL